MHFERASRPARPTHKLVVWRDAAQPLPQPRPLDIWPRQLVKSPSGEWTVQFPHCYIHTYCGSEFEMHALAKHFTKHLTAYRWRVMPLP